MELDAETAQWLQALPLEEPVDIEGESVCLRLHDRGAELCAILFDSYSPLQLQGALRQALQGAIEFDAGLARSQEGSLVLTQWLPSARGWCDAAEPLENLLNQLGAWRESLSPAVLKRHDLSGVRNEQRLRMLFSGVKS